jgi:hypothetical protein
MAETEELTVVMGLGDVPTLDRGPEKAPRAKLVCVDDSLLSDQDNLEFILDGEKETIFGRNEVKFHKVSRRHCRVYPTGGKWGVEDLNSTNGIYVNDVRVTQSALKNGDYLKISSVPFRFVLERPDMGMDISDIDGAQGSAEQTMLVGSRGAGALLQDIMEEDEKERALEEKQAHRRPRPTRASPAGGIAPPKSKTGLWIGLALLLAIAGGGGWYYMNHLTDTGEPTYEALHKQVRKFEREHEENSGTASAGELREQANLLASLLAEMEQARLKYPQHQAMRTLESQSIILAMERHLAVTLASNQLHSLKIRLDEADKTMNALKEGLSGPTLDELKLHQELLALTRDVAGLKLFLGRYPTPSPNAAKKPSPEQMASFHQVRQSFVSRKRSPKNHTALKVNFTILGRIVAEVDAQDLPKLDLWKEYVR